MRQSDGSGKRQLGLSLLAAGLGVALFAWRSVGAESTAVSFTPEQRGYWAFQPVRAWSSPAVGGTLARTPVDAFVVHRLSQEQLSLSPEAQRATLVRRVSFDLVGLPPSPDEVAEFLADESPDAYERLVDRLLASPRHGERLARAWLDLVRFAESDGFKSDNARPHAWRYRDYVIAAFNADKPYDRFLAEQLAGDELAPDDPQALVATGFLRHWPYEDNGRDVFVQRANILADVTDVTGQAFLGLTFQCARCHDHKYDAILQRDYYRLQAFFAPMVDRDDPLFHSPQQKEQARSQRTAWEQATAEVRQQLDALERPVREKMRADAMLVFPKEVQAVLHKPADQRTEQERIIADLAGKQLGVDAKALAGKMPKEKRGEWEAMRKQLDQLAPKQPPSMPVAMAVRDHSPQAPETRVPGHESLGVIEPGYLSILDPRPAPLAPTAAGTTGRRLALAKWVSAADNPLTTRVAVNRLWQHFFGRGIVATAGDFGRQGESPTHPELLDYLASDFVRHGWSQKRIERELVTSAVYRQSSQTTASPRAAEVDPDNKLLWRMRLRRIEGETLRDAMLTVTGELSGKMRGPSVLPELPKELSGRYGWQATPGAVEQHRRSVYLFVKRNLRLPLLDAFDAPDTHACCTRRDVTTTAPQALMLLNDRWSLARAAALAQRVQRAAAADAPQATSIAAAYQLALSRTPTADETASALAFLRSQSAATTEPTALADFCHALLNANEFLYVD